MSNFELKHMTVKKYPATSDYKDEKTDCEIIEIEKFSAKDAEAMKKNGFFLMPNKVTYARKTAPFEQLMKELAKNKRNKIKKAQKQGFQIIQEKKLSNESYAEWHKNVYLPKISGKKLGIITAPKEWLEGTKIGVFAKDKGKIIGGMVAKKFLKDSQFPERMSISYSGVKNEYSKTGVNELLNAMMIDLAYKEKHAWIFRGSDTSIYGKHLSPGIPIFKTSLNFEMLPRKPKVLIKFNNLDKFNDIVFFVSYGKKGAIGNLILKKPIENEKEYRFKFLEKLRVYEYRAGKLILVKRI
jgi:hypothetical protein